MSQTAGQRFGFPELHLLRIIADLQNLFDVVKRLSVLALFDRLLVDALVLSDDRDSFLHSLHLALDLALIEIDPLDLLDNPLGLDEFAQRQQMIELSGVRFEIVGIQLDCFVQIV